MVVRREKNCWRGKLKSSDIEKAQIIKDRIKELDIFLTTPCVVGIRHGSL